MAEQIDSKRAADAFVEAASIFATTYNVFAVRRTAYMCMLFRRLCVVPVVELHLPNFELQPIK